MKKSSQFQKLIQDLPYSSLPISEYNLKYIQRLLPSLDYQIAMYETVLDILNPKQNEIIIDYGGGHGFMSLYFKYLGYQVVYCDFNKNSVQTCQEISKILGFGPDRFIHGSSQDLKNYCLSNNLKPQYLGSTDTLEHIGNLPQFFGDLVEINPTISMVMTTASNPENKWKSRNLRKQMKEVDKSEYLPLRKKFIVENYPYLSPEITKDLAKKSRGMDFKEITEAVEIYTKTQNFPKIDIDQYNTRNPEDGSWFERILPIEEYEKTLNNLGFQLLIFPGFYNNFQSNSIKKQLTKFANKTIQMLGKNGNKIAPFIVLKMIPK